MKILLALNSFKGSCSSLEANQAIKSGITLTNPDDSCTAFPLCDGGDGSIESLQYHLNLTPVRIKTTDVLGRLITAVYLWDPVNSKAYIELAAASGIARLGNRSNNILTSNTSGTGKLILHALKKKPESIVLLVGGSATNDAGLGILQSLGVRIFGRKNQQLDPVPSNLIHIRSIAASNLSAVQDTRFEIWTDVTNYFTGPSGAVAIYSKQKGATPSQQKKLEAGMLNFAKVIQNQFGVDLQKIPGTGAAGGVGGGLTGILGAEIKHGTKKILDLIKFENAVEGHDIILTGEGGLDQQTQYGKLVDGVLKTARLYGKPVIGVCGHLSLTSAEIRRMGFLAAFSIVPGPVTLDYAKSHASRLLKGFGKNLKAVLDFNYSSSSRRE
jgi:glycerate kinase